MGTRTCLGLLVIACVIGLFRAKPQSAVNLQVGPGLSSVQGSMPFAQSPVVSSDIGEGGNAAANAVGAAVASSGQTKNPNHFVAYFPVNMLDHVGKEVFNPNHFFQRGEVDSSEEEGDNGEPPRKTHVDPYKSIWGHFGGMMTGITKNLGKWSKRLGGAFSSGGLMDKLKPDVTVGPPWHYNQTIRPLNADPLSSK